MKAMIEMTKSSGIIISPKELSSVNGSMIRCFSSSSSLSVLLSAIVSEVQLKLVIVMGPLDKKDRPVNWPKRTWLMSLDEALDLGKDIAPIRFSSNPQEDLRTLIFTSGSTGAPKAVMRSDAQVLLAFFAFFVICLIFFDFLKATSGSDTVASEYQIHFCFEPLALAASRLNCYNVVLNGGRIDMFDGNFELFWKQVAVSSPKWFSATPRIWNWLYSNFKTRVDHLMSKEGLTAQNAHDKVVLERWFCFGIEFSFMKKALVEFREGTFGSRCKVAQTGSALGSLEVYEWMRSCFTQMAVFDGYGSTEGTKKKKNKIFVLFCLSLSQLVGLAPISSLKTTSFLSWRACLRWGISLRIILRKVFFCSLSSVLFSNGGQGCCGCTHPSWRWAIWAIPRRREQIFRRKLAMGECEFDFVFV